MSELASALPEITSFLRLVFDSLFHLFSTTILGSAFVIWILALIVAFIIRIISYSKGKED